MARRCGPPGIGAATPGIRRRTLLGTWVLALGPAGLIAGCAPAGEKRRLHPEGQAVPATPATHRRLNGWITLTPEGIADVAMARSEMGQGVHTALLTLVADEMDLTLAQVRGVPAPIAPFYGNVAAYAGVPFRADDTGMLARGARWVMLELAGRNGFMTTGGSTTVRDLWMPMREAAAMARATLVQVVAEQWKVPTGEISVKDGVFSSGGGRHASLAEAVQMASAAGTSLPLAARWEVKSPARFTLIGRPLPRVDGPAIVAGRGGFGTDVRVPGMAFAAFLPCPVRGGAVASFDAAKASAMPGVRTVVVVAPTNGGTGGIAVVADRWWRAQRALAAVSVQWAPGAMAAIDSDAVMQQLGRALDGGDGTAYWKHGDAAAAFDAASLKVQAEYRAPYLAHATLEPQNATALYENDRATVWAPTQVPDFARRAAAAAFGLDAAKVTLNVTRLGGGFGRRLETDVVAQAAQIARQVPGVPVQLIWTRETDTRHDFYRPAMVARLKAGLGAQGTLDSLIATVAGQKIAPQYVPRNTPLPSILTAGPDVTAMEGLFDTPYPAGAVRMGHVAVDLPVPVGFWRAVGHSANAFFAESFIDECAVAARRDPVEFRMALLAERPRHRAVLSLAAQQAGWGKPPAAAADGARVARGVALHESFGAICAQVAEVSVDASRRIRVHRVVAAIDCGLAVNPNIIAQQVEGAIVSGLSAALENAVTIRDGAVVQGNFHEYPIARISQSPAVQVHVVASAEPPGGVGEPGLPPIAPAVANAVAALTGTRLRQMPLMLDGAATSAAVTGKAPGAGSSSTAGSAPTTTPASAPGAAPAPASGPTPGAGGTPASAAGNSLPPAAGRTAPAASSAAPATPFAAPPAAGASGASVARVS